MAWIFTTDGNYVNFNGGGNLWRLHKDSTCVSWHWDETGDLFFSVYDQYYTVKAANIGTVIVGGVTLTTAADFETNIKIVFPGLAGGSASSGYLSYNFGLSQASALVNPTATIRANTFTGGLTWEREDVGVYFTVTDLDYPGAGNLYIVGQYSDAYIPFYSGGGSLQGWARVETGNASGKVRIYVYIEDSNDTPADLADVFGGGNLVNFAEVQSYNNV